MRQVLEKERRMLRWLPLAASALMLLVDGLWGIAFKRHWIEGASGRGPVAAPAEIWALIIVWGLSAALTGAGTTPDLPSRTAQRKALWTATVLQASGTLVLGMLASGVVWAALDIILYGSRMMHTYPTLIETVAIFVSFAFMVQFIGMTLSLFIDEPSNAVPATILAAPAVYIQAAILADQAVKSFFPNIIDTGSYSPLDVLPFLIAVVFGVVFHAVFVHGGLLNTANRIRVGAVAGCIAFLIASAAFVALAPLIAHFR